ncbi:MAG: FG-GAP repeat domain-containing protein, partial [Bryobacteraceae bacterium]
VIAVEAAGRLVRVDRRGRRHTLDTGVEAREAIPARLFGRRGVLLVQRGMQVRFYEPARGRMREIYSFYSSTEQAGLALADVDRDRRPDIFCGNYWIRSPARFDLPWRLFAIRLWSDGPLASVAATAWSEPTGLVAAQAALPNARFARFAPSAGPAELWSETRLEAPGGLDEPATVRLADLNLDGREDVVVAERSGRGRIIIFWSGAEPQVVARTTGVVAAWPVDWNRDGRPDLVVVEPAAVSWWEIIPRTR